MTYSPTEGFENACLALFEVCKFEMLNDIIKGYFDRGVVAPMLLKGKNKHYNIMFIFLEC